MKNIDIKWLYTEYTCDDCGSYDATGAIVSIDGKEAIKLVPSAHCTSLVYWDDADVYREILKYLGYEITDTYEDVT